MRALLFILALPVIAAADTPLTVARFSPDKSLTVDFSHERDPDLKLPITAFTIKNRAGKTIFSDSIADYAESARWTADGKFLILAAAAGNAGRTKEPFRVYFYLISIAHRKWRFFPGSDSTPFVSSKIRCEKPDTIILVGDSSGPASEPPEHTILLRYKVNDLWKTLK